MSNRKASLGRWQTKLLLRQDGNTPLEILVAFATRHYHSPSNTLETPKSGGTTEVGKKVVKYLVCLHYFTCIEHFKTRETQNFAPIVCELRLPSR